jgi:hypothetical protein
MMNRGTLQGLMFLLCAMAALGAAAVFDRRHGKHPVQPACMCRCDQYEPNTEELLGVEHAR